DRIAGNVQPRRHGDGLVAGLQPLPDGPPLRRYPRRRRSGPTARREGAGLAPVPRRAEHSAGGTARPTCAWRRDRLIAEPQPRRPDPGDPGGARVGAASLSNRPTEPPVGRPCDHRAGPWASEVEPSRWREKMPARADRRDPTGATPAADQYDPER